MNKRGHAEAESIPHDDLMKEPSVGFTLNDLTSRGWT